MHSHKKNSTAQPMQQKATLGMTSLFHLISATSTETFFFLFLLFVQTTVSWNFLNSTPVHANSAASGP